jgi:hypothetical protein
MGLPASVVSYFRLNVFANLALVKELLKNPYSEIQGRKCGRQNKKKVGG